jgi:uncharacterized membrane protein YdjX (TVP38/TMEM64 family)
MPLRRPESDPPMPRASAWKGALVLALVCAGLALAASSDTLHRTLLRLLGGTAAIMDAHPVLGVSLFILLSAVSAMLAFFSTAVFVPIAIHAWGERLSILLLWTGWLLGGMCSYAVGRFLGRPVVQSLTSGKALARFEHRISNHAPFTLVLLFQLALPSELPGYLLGLVRYRFVKYLLALAIGELPYAVGTVYLGVSFVERRSFALLGLGIAGALSILWAFHTFQKRLSA